MVLSHPDYGSIVFRTTLRMALKLIIFRYYNRAVKPNRLPADAEQWVRIQLKFRGLHLYKMNVQYAHHTDDLR